GDRAVVPGAGAVPEGGPAASEGGGWGHGRDDPGLGDRLALADREGHVVVGPPLERLRDEAVARDGEEGLEHARVLDAARREPLDHAPAQKCALGLTREPRAGHPSTPRQARVGGAARAATGPRGGGGGARAR